ncbi:MAG: FAD:protein FMN transferase [Rhodobacteraceae bacterium]|nr:FAD:protein FMN transferase [Paracoccaceae bacterium]
MSRTFTDRRRCALNGPTMGTRWSALFHAPAHFDEITFHAALAEAVAEVDRQMSAWKPDSDLNRLNAASPGKWVPVSAAVIKVLSASLAIGKASGGAFDIGVGDAACAWGFGPTPADPSAIIAAHRPTRTHAYAVVELDPGRDRVRKHEPIHLDLNGIAKGYGVDRLAETAHAFGLDGALLAINGELRAVGHQPDGAPWAIAIEVPEPARRAPHSVLELTDMAVATSGDYRNWIRFGNRRVGHLIDPERGLPLPASFSSVSVLAEDCMSADAWATAMMVLGKDRGTSVAQRFGLSAIFIDPAKEETAPRTTSPAGRVWRSKAGRKV